MEMLNPEPTLHSDVHPPTAYLVLLENGGNSKVFAEKASKHKIGVHILGETSFFLLSFDAPDYTLRWLKAIDDTVGKFVLVSLSSYYIL